MAQPYQYHYQYAQLPTYHWQTYDRNAVSFSFHPIIPPEHLYPNDPFADQMKPDDAPPPASQDIPEPKDDTPLEADGEL
jgi:hypothetical protein